MVCGSPFLPFIKFESKNVLKLLRNFKWAFEDWWDASTVQGELACTCKMYVVECNQTFCVILMHHSFPLHQEALLNCCNNVIRKALLTVISAFFD